MPAPTARGDETDLQELPPLDGDPSDPDEEAEKPGQAAADDDDLGAEKTPGGLDDRTGEEDEPHPDDLEVDEGEGQWLDESADAPDLDIGDDLGRELSELDREEAAAAAAAAAAGGAGARPDADDADAAADEAGLGEELEVAGLDSGEEGPEGPDEDLRDQDLPDLGAAEEDESDEAWAEADRLSSDEPMGLKWADRPWTRVGAPVPLTSASALACAARGALVAGRVEARPPELLRVDLEGGCQAALAVGVGGAEVKALAVEGERVAAVIEGGAVALSLDGGAAFELVEPSGGATNAVVASGALWVQTGAGALLSGMAAGSLEPRATGATVVAMTVDAGQCVALLADGAHRPVGLVRGGPDGVLEREALACTEPCGPALVAARGAWVAYAARRGIVRRGPDGVWRVLPWDGSVVALAFVDGDGSLLAATYSDPDDTTGLVRVDPGGSARVMALLGPTQADIESDGRATAIAFDEPRGVVWVAGGFGVAAFATR
jgi:hypothetical protein